MNYKPIIDNINSFIIENHDLTKFVYSTSSDYTYVKMAYKLENGFSLKDIKKEFVSYYNVRGINDNKIIGMLNVVDNNRNKIKNINPRNIDSIYKLYIELLKEISNETGRDERVNTSKLLNLCNYNIPLYDNKVKNFFINMGLKYFTSIYEYYDILNIYNEIINDSLLYKTISDILNDIYKNIKYKYLSEYKMIDTLLLSISDELKEIKIYIK